jgi:hypothetical protein
LKRAFLLLSVIILSLASSCRQFVPLEIEPVLTPVAPTMTPDTCSAEYLSDEMDAIRSGLAEFHEMAYIADNSRADDLISPVMKLEEIRTGLSELSLPPCLGNLKRSYLDYTGMVIRYLSSRMNDPRSDDYKVDQKNSQNLWMAVEAEYEKAVLTVQAEFIPLTGRDDTFNLPSYTGIMAVNDGEQSVNIRSDGNLNSSVIGRLEPGMQALVVGKNKESDWIRVNLMGLYGWVYIDTVELSVPLDEVPFSEIY